ncbi:hypothetical protein LY76DRAFT_596598 [Colletotrichum caudatum]|nr:hypothetical protein LY76DRAFT_596598 [Colletotrichum caudatum]
MGLPPFATSPPSPFEPTLLFSPIGLMGVFFTLVYFIVFSSFLGGGVRRELQGSNTPTT